MEPVVAVANTAEMFDRARRAGVAGIELVPSRQTLREANGYVASVRRAASASSICVSSLALIHHNDGGIAASDEAAATAAADDVRCAVAWAAELGAKVILLPFFGAAELFRHEDVERCATAFRALCATAASRGITLCYEGTLPADEVRELAARVDSESFGCYFDLANPLWRGLDPATELRALDKLVCQVHLKDIWSRPGDCQPGLGRVDFNEVARALADIRYEGWLVLETPPAPPEVLARDLSFARTIFPSLSPRAPTWPRLGAFSVEVGEGEWDRLIKTFIDAGLECVQLYGDLLEECLKQPDRATDFRRALEIKGIRVAALGAYRNLVHVDRPTREANLLMVARCLELAPLLGTSVVSTEAGTRNPTNDWEDDPDNWSDEAWRLVLEAVETLLPVAEQHGSILALEGYVANVLRTEGQLLELLDRFSSPHLQIVCDPYNYLSQHLLPVRERVSQCFLRRFEHRFVIAHLKDVGSDGAAVSTPEFGTGVFPQRPYLEFLRTYRPDLPLILEHLPLSHLPSAVRKVKEPLA